jgi:hypothetical protein
VKNTPAPGAPDVKPFAFGGPGWQPVVADWDGNGTTTIGVVDPHSGRWYLKNAVTPGAPDITPFAYGGPTWHPVAGAWAFHVPTLRADGGGTVGRPHPHCPRQREPARDSRGGTHPAGRRWPQR